MVYGVRILMYGVGVWCTVCYMVSLRSIIEQALVLDQVEEHVNALWMVTKIPIKDIPTALNHLGHEEKAALKHQTDLLQTMFSFDSL